jgi:hypothetical protein
LPVVVRDGSDAVAEEVVWHGSDAVTEEVVWHGSDAVAEVVVRDGSDAVAEEVVVDGSDAVAEEVVRDGSDAVAEEVVADGSSTINEEGVDSSSENKVVLSTGVLDDKGAATGEGNLSTPKAQEAKASAPVTVGAVIAGVAAAMGIVVGGIALLRRTTRPTAAHGGVGVSAGTACTATALQGGAVQVADSAGSDSHKLRIIHVDVDDGVVDV